MKRNKKVFGTWTQDGNVLIKVRECDQPRAIRKYSELKELLLNEEFDQEESDPSDIDFSNFDDELRILASYDAKIRPP